MVVGQAERALRQQEQKDYRYNPEHSLHKVGYVQDKMLDAVMGMDMDVLMTSPKVMENVNSLLANMNGTAVQVTRNSIVESNTDNGAMADAIVDRLAARGMTLIKTADASSDVRGSVPQGLVIDDVDFEEIQPGMLQRGLISQTYDEFADKNDLAKTED